MAQNLGARHLRTAMSDASVVYKVDLNSTAVPGGNDIAFVNRVGLL